MKYKIMPFRFLMAVFMLFLTTAPAAVFCQVTARNPSGLRVLNSFPLYQQSLLHHPEKKMLSLSPKAGLALDLRYATKNNFTKHILYPGHPTQTYLRKPVLMALNRALWELRSEGLGLIIFDAYRPYRVTVALWKSFPDPRYAADPAKGSGHNRGIAVDLTLMDLKTKKPLEMPTGFDNFSDSAHQDYMALEPRIIQHRQRLRAIMEKQGFIALPTEWWHFSWPDPEYFEVLDIGFDELKSKKQLTPAKN